MGFIPLFGGCPLFQSCLPGQAFLKNDALCNLSFNSNLGERCRHYAQAPNKINMLWLTCSLVCVANGDDDKWWVDMHLMESGIARLLKKVNFCLIKHMKVNCDVTSLKIRYFSYILQNTTHFKHSFLIFNCLCQVIYRVCILSTCYWYTENDWNLIDIV